MKESGKFVISLDFELLWGVREKKTISSYGENIMGVWDILPKMINLFEAANVKATFAIVGFLFASNKKELLECSPKKKPNYTNKNLSPYLGHFDLVGENEEIDQYHFASKLISCLKEFPKQEIATHTYSHYYCLEDGQSKEEFKEDIMAAFSIARKFGVTIKSLVFPRNQFNEKYLQVIKSLGITSFRGNEKAWFHKAVKKETLIRRAFRLIDTYLNISGKNCYTLASLQTQFPINIPSSRFLRPYSSKLKSFENLKLKRIFNEMTHAAKNNLVYHLWWHPHNFGINQDKNLAGLNEIINHYKFLNSTYGFESLTMEMLSEKLKKE